MGIARMMSNDAFADRALRAGDTTTLRDAVRAYFRNHSPP